MADIQGPFVDLRTFVNGNISDTNLAASAAIAETKLATGSSGLAKGAFSAFRGAAATYPTASVVVFDNEDFDVSGWFDTATGRFTPQAAGYYRLSWCVRVQGTTLAADKFWLASLRKNGTVARIGQLNWQRGASGINSTGASVVSANGTTDFFDVIIEHDHTAGAPLLVGTAQTYFTGEMIGRS